MVVLQSVANLVQLAAIKMIGTLNAYQMEQLQQQDHQQCHHQHFLQDAARFGSNVLEETLMVVFQDVVNLAQHASIKTIGILNACHKHPTHLTKEYHLNEYWRWLLPSRFPFFLFFSIFATKHYKHLLDFTKLFCVFLQNLSSIHLFFTIEELDGVR